MRSESPDVMAIRFCEAIRYAITLSQIKEICEEFILAFRLDTFACGEVDLHRLDRTVLYVVGWPKSWRDHYVSSGLLRRDPIVAELAHRRRPFTWSQLRQEGKIARAGRDSLELFAHHGWTEGLAVPLHRGGSRYGLVTMKGNREPIVEAELGALCVMATALYEAARRVAPVTGAQVIIARLSPRELDCLRLIACGLSDRQIGGELLISPATAHGYVETARRKLNAKSRAEAVALAVSLGLVDHLR